MSAPGPSPSPLNVNANISSSASSSSSNVQQQVDPLIRLAQLEMQIQNLQARNVVVNNSAVGSSSRPKAPPMTQFNGMMGLNGFEIDQWLREVNKQFTHFGDKIFPDDNVKISFAVEWLTGAAQDWWENEDKQGINNWDTFVERLRNRYRPQMPAELARQRLRTLVQRGRCEQYCNEFLKVVARIPNRNEEDKIFDFKAGLDRVLAAKVAEKQPKTLQEAMEIAVQAEPYVTTRGGGYHGMATSFRNANFGRTNNASSSSSASSNSSGAVPMELNAVVADNNVENNNNINSSTASGEQDQNIVQMLLSKIENMEHRLHAMSYNRNGNTAGTNGGNHSSSSRNDRIPGLTSAEISSLRKEGRCFRCKQKGHMKNECSRLKF